MTDSDVKFAVPAEAVACLREALDDMGEAFGDALPGPFFADLAQARAALESLAQGHDEWRELADGLSEGQLDYAKVLGEAEEELRQARARISALESELSEKTARVATLELSIDGRSELPCPGCDCDVRAADGTYLCECPCPVTVQLIRARSRIAELESRTPSCSIAGRAGAGELAAAIREVEVQCDDMSDAVALVAAAARSWAALQWREPLPGLGDLLLCARVGDDDETLYLIDDDREDIADQCDWCIPLDALPALPSEPVKP